MMVVVAGLSVRCYTAIVDVVKKTQGQDSFLVLDRVVLLGVSVFHSLPPWHNKDLTSLTCWTWVACTSCLKKTESGVSELVKQSMMKRLPSRSNRSKGIRVKHVLQIVLLLGVCFWLIYQVKHNHDKKKEYDENDEKLLVQTQANQILKLGRKDLHPVKDEVNRNEKRDEEEEDENVVEDVVNKAEPTYEEDDDEGSKNETEESEDNKHEVRDQREEENKLDAEEQQEEDENKSEEMEDEGRGVGDDEIDENDQEKTEVGTDHDEEFVDEEKEKEEVDEKENENGEGEGEGKGELVENHNTREAREEHYKGDDASSAVTHDAHTTNTETEALSLGNSDEKLVTNKTKPENEATYSDESNSNQKDSDLKVTEGDLTRNPSNATSGIEGGNNTLSNPVDSSNLNDTATANSNNHLEASSDMKNVTTEASKNLSGAGVDILSSSDQNKTVILSESDHSQNSTGNTTISGDDRVQTDGLVQGDNRNSLSEENLHDSNATATVKTENGDASAGESLTLGSGESENARLLASNETGNGSRNEISDVSEGDNPEGNSGSEDEIFKGDSQTDEMSDESSANGTSDSVDGIDSSDDAKFRTDLDTLPDFRNEGENGDEIAAE
ncbi:dentin sialophosphoprotein-like isoform X1 [Arachis ipaensis]|nr:dentin sialophosphoprotein-like isoform X1 [Arachis ipaensis]XP_025674598.1 dentin sialophosphoprotein isoform X1 [Arachis hypogaea]